MTSASLQADAERRGRRLEYFTLTWNVGEAVVALTASGLASSVALLGFGIDSVIESLSGGILLWRLQSNAARSREEPALKLVGASFFLLAAYVLFDSLKTLLAREPPTPTAVGVALACASLIVMPLLARAKRQVAARLSSNAPRADSRQTDLCFYLSGILLLGLLLNQLLGWWWADPVAALLMVPIMVHEGRSALRGERCDDCQPVS